MLAEVNAWDDVDRGTVRRAQKLAAAARPKRAAARDEYETAYDTGKVKKRRQKGAASGGGAAAFQAAQQQQAGKAARRVR